MGGAEKKCEYLEITLKSISSFIFQAILLKFSGNVPYIIRKKRYVGILIIKKKIYEKNLKKNFILL